MRMAGYGNTDCLMDHQAIVFSTPVKQTECRRYIRHSVCYNNVNHDAKVKTSGPLYPHRKMIYYAGDKDILSSHIPKFIESTGISPHIKKIKF